MRWAMVNIGLSPVDRSRNEGGRRARRRFDESDGRRDRRDRASTKTTKRGTKRLEPGNQHPGAAAIILILSAEQADEIALLVADRNQNVDGHAGGEEEMAGAHRGRRPESKDEARIERMGAPLVERGGGGLRGGGGVA